MKVWPWSRRGRRARELEDELRFHHEMRVSEFMARGNTRETAERLARERFGDLDDLTEYCHRMDTHIVTRTRRLAWFADIWFDLRHGLRQVRQHHGIALVAVLTLGLGIGATTATYAVVHKLLVSPLPGVDGDRVVRLSRTNKERSFSISVTLEIADAWRSGVPALEAVETYASREVSADFGSGKEALDVGVMSLNFLGVFGVSPAMGRTFASGEVNVAVISNGVWRQRYGASANVLGKSIHLDGVAHTIVGVLPSQFVVPFATGGHYDVWVPLDPAGPRVFPTVIARLRPGTTIASLQRELDTVLASLAADSDGHSGLDRTPWQAMVARPQDDLGKTTGDSVLVLFGAVAIVLLAGCANVANLLLARAQTRQREFVIRHALGAGRGRLVRQLLAESSLLAVGGWLLGLAVMVGCIELAQALRPLSLATLDGLVLEPRLVWISMLISLITAGLFGLAPALVAAGRRPSADMKRQALSATSDRRVGRWRNALVVVEVGLSVVLLVGGGLLIRTLWAMQHAPLGFDPAHLVSAEITLPLERYSNNRDRLAAFQRLLDRVKAVPGVTQATWALGVPPNLGVSVGTLQIEGRTTTAAAREFIGFNTASPDYFALTKTPIVEGQLYDSRTQSEDVIMVSQSLARRHWPGASAVGQRMRLSAEGPWSSIVGVVGDVTIPRPGGAQTVREVVYTPFDGSIDAGTLVIRGSGALTGLFPALTGVAAQVDPQIKISSIISVTDALAQSQALPRFIASILAAFAVMAVLLASAGLYGVIAYTVSRRWREMGIRLALGARPSDVVKPVLFEGAWMTATGLAAGLAGAYAATGALRSLLFQVQPLDPTTFAVASAVLAAVSLMAVYLPARRATRVNPLRVLREE